MMESRQDDIQLWDEDLEMQLPFYERALKQKENFLLYKVFLYKEKLLVNQK